MCNLESLRFISKSFIMHEESIASNNGCLDSLINISFFSEKQGLTNERGALRATYANAAKTSISDINLDAFSITG